MTMIIRKLAIAFMVIFCFYDLAFGEFTISQIVNRYSPSIVTIIALDENDHPISSGSGFFINRTGDIATNHHVLQGSVRAIVETLDGKKGGITEIVKDDPRLDLLVARTTIGRTTPLLLGDSDRITVGDDIVGIGNPAGSEGTISMGVINHVREVEGIKLIQITAPISPGCSGGPIFSLTTGKVIGIATAFLNTGQDINFAMPVNYLKTLKPARLNLGSLPRMTTRIEAAVSDRTVLELFVTQNTTGPGTVYFKNGKKLVCDRAWKDGSTVFLVVHGKKIAVGYYDSQIDIERSFVGYRK